VPGNSSVFANRAVRGGDVGQRQGSRCGAHFRTIFAPAALSPFRILSGVSSTG
jgi:hypothetical protein